jgi:hypothetical protein
MKNAALSLMATFFPFAGGNALAQNTQQSPSATGNWIISETTSPVDYSPVVVATTRSQDSIESSAVQLSLYCRNGRTYLVLTGQAISGSGDDYVISYGINGDPPTRAGVGSSPFGTGIAFQGDVVNLLQSLPDEGEIAIRFAKQAGAAREANFSLSGLKVVRSKMAAACRWPRANTRPHD